MCSTSNGTCRIIDVSYKLIFTFGAPNSIDEHLKVPITIGTIPLRDLARPSAPLDSQAPPSYGACLLFFIILIKNKLKVKLFALAGMFDSNPNKDILTDYDQDDYGSKRNFV